MIIRTQFEAFTSRFAFALRSRMNQKSLVELGLAVFGGELGADLASAVVKEQFVVAAKGCFLSRAACD